MEKNKAGFTLFELLLVIMIIFIISSLSSGGIRFLVAKSRLDSDVRELYYAFLKARQLAIYMQERYGLSFDEENREYTIFSDSEGNLETRRLREGVRYQEITFGGDNRMIFKPLGTAEGGHIILTNETKLQYEIVVSGTVGRVRYKKIDN